MVGAAQMTAPLKSRDPYSFVCTGDVAQAEMGGLGLGGLYENFDVIGQKVADSPFVLPVTYEK